MGLMGLIEIESLGGKRYIFVTIDDFSKFTWVDILREKFDTFEAFKKFCVRLKVEKYCNISKLIKIRSDQGK